MRQGRVMRKDLVSQSNSDKIFWAKVRKPSKIEQDQKILKSTFG